MLGLVRRDRDLTDAASRSGSEPAEVVRDLRQRRGQCFERTVRIDEGIFRRERFEFVRRRDERVAGELAKTGRHALPEIRMSVQAGADGRTAERELFEVGERVGQALDAVVTGVITRYNDRNGTALSTERPTSVSFDVYLISVEDGKVLWNATFDETQGPLSDNLLMIGRYFKGGGVWQTNDALARNGMNRLVETFPGISTESREGSPEPPVPLDGEMSGQ